MTLVSNFTLRRVLRVLGEMVSAALSPRSSRGIENAPLTVTQWLAVIHRAKFLTA